MAVDDIYSDRNPTLTVGRWVVRSGIPLELRNHVSLLSTCYNTYLDREEVLLALRNGHLVRVDAKPAQEVWVAVALHAMAPSLFDRGPGSTPKPAPVIDLTRRH